MCVCTCVSRCINDSETKVVNNLGACAVFIQDPNFAINPSQVSIDCYSKVLPINHRNFLICSRWGRREWYENSIYSS